MVKRLLDEGYKVVGVDIKPLVDWHQNFDNYSDDGSPDNEGVTCISEGEFNLRDANKVEKLIKTGNPDELYQFAADMGGAGYINTL